MSEGCDALAKELAELEQSVDSREKELQKKYPDVFAEIAKIEADKGRIKDLKDALKAALIEDDDLDMHTVSNKKYSVSKVVVLKVDDIDEVPDDFKSMQMVANEKKAQDYYKLMDEPPKGFKDKSYYKFNWKEL